MENKFSIEARSEAIVDYLERVPSLVIATGSSVIFVLILIILAASWIIKYPSIIRANIKLSTEIVPKPAIARVNGHIERILVKDNQLVEAKSILAYIENPADHAEVLKLQKQVLEVDSLFKLRQLNYLSNLKLSTSNRIGDVQIDYQKFVEQFSKLNLLVSKKYSQKKIRYLQTDITHLQAINNALNKQYAIYNRDTQLAEQEYLSSKDLYKNKVIPKIEIDREESKFLAKRVPLNNTLATISRNSIEIDSKKAEILDLEQQVSEQKEVFQQAINTLLVSIESWKSRYLLVAPAAGNVKFVNNIQTNNDVKIGEEVFRIYNNSPYVGVLSIPLANASKIKAGQHVRIKFSSFAFEEYGMVTGIIMLNPELAFENENSLISFVRFPNGLRTSQNFVIPYTYGMQGSAEIITDDTRLAERFFYKLKKIF